MKSGQSAIKRRGLSLSGLLMLIATIAGVGTMAWFATPIVLRAGSDVNDGEVDLSKLPDEFRGLVDALDILLRKSKATCLIREEAGAGESVEFIVLWVSDDDDIGHVNESEVAILRFSEFLGSITLYARAEKSGGWGGADAQKNRNIDGMLQTSSFIDSFLHEENTHGRVIGVHITSMRIDGTKLSDNGRNEGVDSSVGRIELTYRGHSADTPIVALVPTALPPLNR